MKIFGIGLGTILLIIIALIVGKKYGGGIPLIRSV